MPVNFVVGSGGGSGGSIGTPEYGYANLANQTVALASGVYADVTGSSMALTPGTWEITYTVVTDHSSGVTGIPHIVVTDSLNAVVEGSQRSRPGAVTTAQTLTAVVVLTVAVATTYKLRISNGGSGTMTLLNSTTSKSTLAWVKLAGLAVSVTDHSDLTGLAGDGHPQYLNNARGDSRYQPLNPVLTATTASFTAADEAKLDGIAGMTGASALSAGAAGLVPAPTAGQQGSFLRGDGTWAGGAGGASVHSDLTGLASDDHPQYHTDARGDARYSALGHTHAYQPLDPVLTATTASFTAADETKLDALVNTPPMTGATSTLPGIAGYVPAPAAGDEVKFLTGAGTWAGQVGGITDHGALTGLADDDHPQYHNDARGDLRYQPLSSVLTATTASFTTADETKLDALGVMVGATAGAAGVTGTVPAALAGEQDKFLRADGTWADTAEPLEIFSHGRVLNATGQQGTTSTTGVAVNLTSGTTRINTGGFTVTPASGQVVVSVAGNYQISFTGYNDDAGGTASGLNTFLRIGGVTVAQSSGTMTDGYTTSAAISTIQVLSAGAVITVVIASTDGETVNLQGYDLNIVQLGVSAYTTTNLYTGATAVAAGVTGGVPPAAAGDQAKFLTGGGTWVTSSASPMVGATAVVAGTGGGVPAPAAGVATRYLQADATWATIPVPAYASITLAANVDVNSDATLWVSRNLAVTLPSAGTYRVFWSVSGEVADAGTTEVALSGRLYNVTTATAYDQSKHMIVGYDSPTASVSTRLGNGCGEAIVVVTAANSVTLQTRMSAIASAGAIIMGDSYARGTSYMSYVKLG